MKKKLSLVLVAVMGVTVAFSGCNLFVTDKNAYYNQTIASITTADGTNITIDKEDLMQAYNRYASSLENSGYSGQDLIDKLVDTLIDQKIVINETTKLINEGKITISNADKNEMWTDCYEAMIGLLEDYEEEVSEDWDLATPDNPESEDDDKTVYEKYEPEAKIVKVNVGTQQDPQYEYKIEIIDNADDSEQTLIYSGDPVDSVIAKINTRIEANKVSKEAQKRYIYDLKQYQEGRGFSEVDADVWKAEVQRVYNNIQDNMYISLYTDYLETVESDNGTKYSILSVQDVMSYLEKNIKSDYVKYTANTETFKTDILSNRSDVDYVISGDGIGEYFYVSHILVKFSDDQFTELETLLDNGYISQADYDYRRNELVYNTLVKEYGEEVAGYTVEELYNDFKTAMSSGTTQDKLNTFNDFMYKYNEDTGNKNQTYDYIVGTDDSEMVESFTEAARELYNNGQGQVGDISGMVESEYGIHILIYLGKVENAFTVTDVDEFVLTGATGADLDQQVKTITTTKLSLLNEKTIFDDVYEALEEDTVSVLENLNVNTLKHDAQITIYYGHYTDLY